MTKDSGFKEIVEIPQELEVVLDHTLLKIKGPAGENERNLANPSISISEKDKQLILTTRKNTKKEKRMLNTYRAHIKNIIQGVQAKYIYKLKICSGHFPMTVTYDNNILTIKNFLGEKIPRTTKVQEGVDLKINGEIIEVSGVDKEKTSQTAAKIEKSTRISKRDKRIFNDGVWIISKGQLK